MSKHTICACKECKSSAESIGLCSLHLEESLSARKKGTFHLWCLSKHVYLSHAFDSNNERIFKYSGQIIKAICKCGSPYNRPEKGGRHLCPDCIYLRHKNKWTKQNSKRESIKKILRNRGDADPNFKPFIHRGKPRTVVWNCEFSGCSLPYEITLLEHKTRYYRFCPQHRGII